MTLDRRTVVRGAAWTLPAVAVSTQAPAFAASPCGAVPFAAGWVLATTGSFKTTSGSQGYTTSYASAVNGAQPVDSVNRFLSEQDSSRAGNADPTTAQTEATAANSSTITLYRDLTLVPGRAYNFEFSIASRFANDTLADSQNQFLQIQMIAGGTTTDGLRLVKGSSNTTHFGNLGAGGWTQLPALTATKTPATNTGVRSQLHDFDYTPPAGVTSVRLQLLFTLPSRRRANGALYPGQSDIAVSAPAITGEGC